MEKQNAIERPNLNKATQTQGKRRKKQCHFYERLCIWSIKLQKWLVPSIKWCFHLGKMLLQVLENQNCKSHKSTEREREREPHFCKAHVSLLLQKIQNLQQTPNLKLDPPKKEKIWLQFLPCGLHPETHAFSPMANYQKTIATTNPAKKTTITHSFYSLKPEYM